MRLSRDPAARRRLAALVAAALASLLAGLVAGARDGGGGARDADGASGGRPAALGARERRELSAQVGQLLVLRFAGTAPPRYVRRALRSGRAGGVVLFADNVESPGQLRALTRALQRAAGGSALIATDQEGGPVRNVPWAGPVAGPPGQPSPELAETSARDAAVQLRANGVNVNLAPVADVPSGPGSAMSGRAFPGDAERVAALVAAAVRGHRAGGVAATVKHFPGLGLAADNTDDAPVTIAAAASQLDTGLEPFRAAVRARAPLVMASHALYPAYDGQRIASQSPRVLGDLLRGRLGFRGIVVTDSLEAEAVVSRSGVATAAERSVGAGADLVLMTGRGSFRPVYRRLLHRAERSPAFRKRVREAAGRVAGLRRALGLRPQPRAT